MTRRNHIIGAWGEEQACRFLERHGFIIKDRNYHTTTGEIDIVAEKGGDYYFIEVKTRHEQALANDTSITGLKRHRLLKTIKAYCYHHQVVAHTVMAGLIVRIDRTAKCVSFRLCVFY